MKTSEGEISRRSELVCESKTRNLSMDEVKELQVILAKEARYSYASGEIGFIAFVCIDWIIRSLAVLGGAEEMLNE